jgi:hypothetical protein
MDNLEIKENINIENLIYEIRGKQVILASDVAKLYGEETKRINEVVKRNINRFPNEFCFKLTDEESNLFWSQIATKKIVIEKRGGSYKNPYVFTEHGIIMLSGLLKNNIAIKINIMVIEAFIAMKKYVSSDLIKQRYINNMIFKHENEIKLLQESFNKFESKNINNHIFFEGQIYDAYSLMMTILNKEKKNIIIIDNYAGRELFDLIKEINIKTKIYSKNIDENALIKYQKQYHNLEIIYNNKFHDRFIIIDKKTLYHCGASFKELGNKCFAINLIENEEIIKSILNNL